MSSVKVSIKDFQSIGHVDFEIAGFTCITGPTNIGKSAIVRAISSAILNKSVVGSVRKGKKFCTVEIDGLKWEKGERVGRYWVPGEKDENGNAKPRDSIGQGQTEVTEIMGFRSVKVGDKHINPWLATQFDPIFLMQDSGPAVTDFISDITHLKVLQDAIAVCVRKRQRLLQSVKDREEELVGIKSKESALDGLDNLLLAEKDMVQQMDSLEEYGRAISRLRYFISSVGSENEAIASLSRVKDVRLPKAHADPGSVLMPLARLWSEVEAAAIRVSPIKGIMKVSVPDAPDQSGVEAIVRTSRFLSIPSLSASVAVLEGAKRVQVPEAPESGVPQLLRAATILSEMDATRSLLGRLGREMPPIPDFAASRFSDPGGLAWTALAMLQMEKETFSIRAMEDQLRKVEADISSTEEEIAKIPTCPTCRQVFVQAHQHA